jgi:hypothetical protein
MSQFPAVFFGTPNWEIDKKMVNALSALPKLIGGLLGTGQPAFYASIARLLGVEWKKTRAFTHVLRLSFLRNSFQAK